MDMSQYLEMFITESEEHIQAMNTYLLDLENNPQNAETLIKDFFRAAHTLKGMSASMGYRNMNSLTHEMENVLDLLRNNKLQLNPFILDSIFTCVDILEKMLQAITDGNDDSYDVNKILNDLKRIVKGDSQTTKHETPSKSTIQINSELNAIIAEAKKQNLQVVSIEVSFTKECQMRQVRSYMVFKELESLGEVIVSNPHVSEIEQNNIGDSIQVVLITGESSEQIQKSLLSISEIEKVDVNEVEEKKIVAPVEVKKEEVTPVSALIQAETTSNKKATISKSIRVDIEKLDVLMNLFSELVIDKNRLEELVKSVQNSHLSDTVEHIARISGELQNVVLNMRMVPIDNVFSRFPRMVRDLSKELNKKINFVIEGAETELDKTIIDEIGDPLVHLIRNSLDHGVETVNERIETGKPEEGNVTLKAYHSGNSICIEIKDDGRGIKRANILKKAIEKGITDSKTAERLSDEDVFAFLFASGFSTAEKISDISGRGVGLDVVKTKIESLGGKVFVFSKEGQGTTFLVELPLTLSIISSMLIRLENETYAVPLNSVVETLSIQESDILNISKMNYINVRNNIIPLADLKSIYKVPSTSSIATKKQEHDVIVLKKGDKQAAFIVDEFIGQQEIVLKNLGTYLNGVKGISGSTIIGNGQVALIIDPNALIL